MIKIKLQNGLEQSVPYGTNVYDIINKYLLNYKKKAIAAYFNHELIELKSSLTKDGVLEIINYDHVESLKMLNYSVSYLLSKTLNTIYKDILPYLCYYDEKGFYCDVDFQDLKISNNDFMMIEKKMRQIILEEKSSIIKEEINYQKAQKIFTNNVYKKELLEEMKDKKIFIYKQGNFCDFCFGLHVPNIKLIKYFKLLKISGVYYKGDSNKKQITRIYGTAFFNKNDFDNYLKVLEEQKKRDHKHINKELNFFMFANEIGLGLPIWLPKGATVRRVIERYIIDKEIADGYEHVYTPVIANTEVYSISGHLSHYYENMFPLMTMPNGEQFVLRPMNCPHHMMIYKNKIYSYKELPLRIAELGMMHRFEKSGAVSGLQRVREMTLNDAHIFIRIDQIKEEFKKIIFFIQKIYSDFNISEYKFRLSYRDPLNKKKYFDDDFMWNQAENILKEIMLELKLNFIEAKDEAAFYGPKLDVQVMTALGHEETLSSVQIDFLLPKRFNLKYIDKDGKSKTPILIHRCIVSTMERFFAYLLERYEGFLPFWLSPLQIIVIPIKINKHLSYAQKIKDILLENNFRVEINHKDVTLNYKIREAQKSKIPYQLVIGDNEISKNTITFREYRKDQKIQMSINEFVSFLKEQLFLKK